MSKKEFDGNEHLIEALKKLNIDLVSLIAETSIWASQEACRIIENETGSSTRYPTVRRGKHYERKGEIIDGIRIDDNTYANNAIKNAIGINRKDIKNFDTCHIYPNTCYDERYHTKIENLVLMPNSIAKLSDHFDDVKNALKYRAYELYGWYPEEEKIPERPANYPTNWRKPMKPQLVAGLDLQNQNLEAIIESEEELYFDRERQEIEKIQNRVPKWIQKGKTQINSIILLTFLELLNGNSVVSREILRNKCFDIKDFNGNFNQMSHFGEKNHGKVFEVNKDDVSLWEPVAKFIIGLYERQKE